MGFWGYTANYNSKMNDYATLREGMSHFIARSYFTLDYLTKVALGPMVALANALAGADLAPGNDDIDAF